jgi:2-oxoisovalerate dehydrogenase E1 component
MPALPRISVFAKYGAQPHFPGLRVAYPVTPYAAEGITNSALAETNPVLFLESPRVYVSVEILVRSGVPGEYYLGPALDATVKAANKLGGRFGMSPSTIHLRSANPLNYCLLKDAVRKTGKLLLVSDPVERGSVTQTDAANPAQISFDHLHAPPRGARVPKLDQPGTETGNPVLLPTRVVHRCNSLANSVTYGSHPVY